MSGGEGIVRRPLLILVAGPYRSGTNDDPALIARNMHLMTETSLDLFRICLLYTSPSPRD